MSRIQVPKWADDAYRDFHWGDEADTIVEARAPSIKSGETLIVCGELVEIVYRARKGSNERYDWVHAFKRPRPILTYQESGQLVIVGGNYRVTPRGIVG